MVLAAKMNAVWQRVLFESMALKVSCQDRLEERVNELIVGFLDNSLQSKLCKQPDDSDVEDDELFDKKERTTKSDDLDFFSKLMR